MSVIWRFPLNGATYQWIEMPVDAKILCVRVNEREPCLYALCDDSGSHTEGRLIATRGTGEELNFDGQFTYLDTYQLREGGLVYHVFEDHNR